MAWSVRGHLMELRKQTAGCGRGPRSGTAALARPALRRRCVYLPGSDTKYMYREVKYYMIFPKMRYEYDPNDLYLSVMNPTPRIALFVGWFVGP